MVKEFAKIHSSENLSEEERRRREGKISLYSGVLERKEEVICTIGEPFTMD